MPRSCPFAFSTKESRRAEVGPAIEYAISHGAKVINLSLGDGLDPETINAVQAAQKADVVVIAAAGNKPEEFTIAAPAFLDSVVAVGAIDRSGKKAAVSVSGIALDLMAPGEDIAGREPQRRVQLRLQERLILRPLCLARLLLIRSKYPDMSATEVVERLESTAIDKGPPGVDPDYGHGIIDIVAALSGGPGSPASAAPSTATPAPPPPRPPPHPQRPSPPAPTPRSSPAESLPSFSEGCSRSSSPAAAPAPPHSPRGPTDPRLVAWVPVQTDITPRLVLASASPARRALLSAAGIDVDVLVSGVDESVVEADDAAYALCLALARMKARAVAATLPADPGVLVLGCDSVLAFDGEILGKPARRRRGRQAVAGHARAFRGAAHRASPDRPGQRQAGRGRRRHRRALRRLTDDEISAYVATGEPLQVAGAFTIDGRGGAFVERIEGDAGNVIGLVPAACSVGCS